MKKENNNIRLRAVYFSPLIAWGGLALIVTTPYVLGGFAIYGFIALINNRISDEIEILPTIL